MFRTVVLELSSGLGGPLGSYSSDTARPTQQIQTTNFIQMDKGT